MGKLLVFDLDGTLLTSEKAVSPRTSAAIWACKERGMIIEYSTARARPFFDRAFFTDDLPCDFIAFYNGAEICANGVPIETHVIPYHLAMIIVRDVIRDAPVRQIGIHLEPWSFKKGEIWNLRTGEKRKCDLSRLPHCDVQRIRIEFETLDGVELRDYMTRETVCFITSDGAAMILNRNATKENALRKAAQWFHIPLSDAIAFGDDVTDIGMLRAAGTGVAMANAVDDLKAAADETTESNDGDGVAVWIEAHLLN